VAVYNDMPPFHVAGSGHRRRLAARWRSALGVKLTLLPFNADENMNDDLRNLVWRGHYLGFGPADVLLHVPVDRR
jgi:polar amino acid transport system substrate-binding protein